MQGAGYLGKGIAEKPNKSLSNSEIINSKKTQKQGEKEKVLTQALRNQSQPVKVGTRMGLHSKGKDTASVEEPAWGKEWGPSFFLPPPYLPPIFSICYIQLQETLQKFGL